MKLLCVISGSDTVFVVKINKTQYVDELRQAITTERSQLLDGVDAASLTLYKINVVVSNTDNHDEIVQKISRGVYEFEEIEKLNAGDMVSRYFVRGLSGVMQVLAERPPGEPIDSTARDDACPWPMFVRALLVTWAPSPCSSLLTSFPLLYPGL
jgi:hypothetical protein